MSLPASRVQDPANLARKFNVWRKQADRDAQENEVHGNTPRHTDQNRTSRYAPNSFTAIPATTREAI